MTICSEIEFETFGASALELRSTLQLFALQLSLPCLHKYSCISWTNKAISVHLFSHNRRAYLDFVKCFSMSGKKYEFLFSASFRVQTAYNLSNLWKWGKTVQVMAQPLKTSFLVGQIFLVFDFDLGWKENAATWVMISVPLWWRHWTLPTKSRMYLSRSFILKKDCFYFSRKLYLYFLELELHLSFLSSDPDGSKSL